MRVETRELGEERLRMRREPGECDFIVPGRLELVGQQEGERFGEGCWGHPTAVDATATGLRTQQLFSEHPGQNDERQAVWGPGDPAPSQ